MEYDQTAFHLHHAPEMEIQLPKNFNLEKYKSMAKPEKIKYAKENVPRETIIFVYGYEPNLWYKNFASTRFCWNTKREC
jgi:hypothetical protein